MSIVDAIIAAMQTKIEAHGLELMKRYPNDLLIHDRAIIERAAHKGATIAWAVGHTHTHTFLLGVHADENRNVASVTNLSKDDKFHVLKIGTGSEGFTIQMIDRQAFENLQRIPVPYRRIGTASDFWLYRGDERVGHCKVTSHNIFSKHTAHISPVAGSDGISRAALHTWAAHAVVELTGSIITPTEACWLEPVPAAA